MSRQATLPVPPAAPPALALERLKLPRKIVRAATFIRETVNVEARTVELAFASEEPVERWFGYEILGHGEGECDLEFMASGRAPLLSSHNHYAQIGVVASARIGTDRKSRAVVRFGRSELAEQEFRDVQEGIRVNTSVGYEILEATLVKVEDDVKTYRMRWRPFEISLVSVPADVTVGVGRQAGEADIEVPIINPTRGKDMSTATQPVQSPANPSPSAPVIQMDERQIAELTARAAAAAVEAYVKTNKADEEEKVRRAEIKALCERHTLGVEFREKHINDKTPLEVFRGIVLGELEKRGSTKPLYAPPAEIGLGAKELRSYSLAKALVAHAERDWSVAPFEQECAKAVAERVKGQVPAARGFYIPTDMLFAAPVNENQRLKLLQGLGLMRDQTVGTAGQGGNLVATNLLGASFIELLRNLMMVRAMGATILPGLVGNVAIPKQTAAATANWVAESGASGESQATFAQVMLSLKTVHAVVDYTRDLLLQSTPAIEQLVRDDIMQVIALAIDLAALHGSGSANQPTGIAATVGIGSVVGGTNGAAPTWQNIVDLETQVAQNNAAVGRVGYLTNAKVRGKLKTTPKVPGYPVFIWDGKSGTDGMGEMNGYMAGVTNQVSSTLTKGSSAGVCSAIFYGNWADLLIGEWGILEMLTDNVTQAANRVIRAHAYQSVDIAVRRAQSFSAMLDALTT